VCEFFTPIAKENANLAMVGLTCKMPPYSETGAVDDSVHNAEETILVLRGVLEITIEEEVFILNTGDSIYIKPNLRHVMKNIGDGELEVISCISPAIY
jgi:quercetin dioxygenase-like cupin family protein